MQELLGGQAMFARLGLRFECKSGDNVRMVFTQIDATAPGREFVVGICVSASEEFELRECSPPIASMSDLLEQLNATSDLALFVRQCRAAFKAMCAPAGAAGN